MVHNIASEINQKLKIKNKHECRPVSHLELLEPQPPASSLGPRVLQPKPSLL